MEKSDNTANQTLSASLCTAGCGFFGNQQFDGMCSQCYKDALKRKQASPDSSSCARSSTPPSSSHSVETGTTTIKPLPITSSTLSAADFSGTKSLLPESSAETKLSTAAEEGAVSESAVKQAVEAENPASPAPSEPEKKSKKRNRCGTCKKKVGLTGFECRCGGLYCGLHRYSDKHDCQYDYKKEGEETIRKNNPLIVGAKVQKI